MKTCIKIEQSPGCWTKSDGSTENVLIVREYGVGDAGQAVLARTHYTNVAGDHVTAGAGEVIRLGACLECCSKVEISDVNPPGKKIATVTLLGGETVDLNETITTFSTLYNATTGVKIGEYTNEAGAVVEVFSATQTLDVNPTAITYVPAASGNTTNLNQVVVDPSGSIWIIDAQGDAQKMTVPAFKELNRFYADPNGSDTNAGANEAPFQTAQAAVNALGQGDTAVLNEGTYGAVTMATQNTTISGASNGYSGLVQIASLTATAVGTSVRAEGLTVTGNVSHTGTAPLYLNNVTVNGSYASSSTAYTEIKDSRIQDGTISKTAAGTLFIRDSQIGNATFSTANSVIALRNVNIDAGDKVTIGAGVIYSLQDVVGEVVINAAAISAEQAVLAQGGTADQAEGAVTSHFMQLRMHTPDTETAPSQIVTWDPVTHEMEISPFANVSGDKYKTTSTTCQNIVSTGQITLTVATGLAYTPLQDIIVYADVNNHMHGQVVTYNTATGALVMDVQEKSGSGNFCNWTVNLDAIKLAPVSVYYGATDPVTAGQAGVEGDLWYKTTDGTGNSSVQQTWVFDDVYGWKQVDQKATDANWVDVTTTPAATGNVAGPRFEKLADGSMYYIDATGRAEKVEDAAPFEPAVLVYVNGTDPNAATVFDDMTPPVTNDNTLKADGNNLYIGTDGNTWVYDSATGQYKAYIPENGTEWYFQNTTTDAGADKTNTIYRIGNIGVGGFALTDANLTMYQNTLSKGIALTGAPVQLTQQSNGARWTLGVNLTDNVQHWFGDYNAITNNAINTGYEVMRFIHVKGEVGILDAVGPGFVRANIHIGQEFVGIGNIRGSWTGQPLYHGHIRGTAGIDTLPTYSTATDLLVKNPASQQIGVRTLSSVVASGVSATAVADASAPNSSRTIGTVTVAGAPTNLKETVTSLFVDSALTGPTVAIYYNESGDETNIPGVNALTATQSVPTATGNTANKNTVFKATDGNAYFVDAGGDSVQLGSAPVTVVPVTTSLTPVYQTGATKSSAQASVDTTLADLLALSDGSYVNTGKITWTGHGLTVGSWYYTSQSTAGAYVTPAPTSGFVQQLFFVEDANTIHVNIEQAVSVINAASSSPIIVTARFTSTPIGTTTTNITTYVSKPVESFPGSFNTSTGVFTAPVSGYYRAMVTMTPNPTAAWALNQYFQIMLTATTGTFAVRQARVPAAGSYPLSAVCDGSVYLTAGQTITVSAIAGQTATLSANEYFNQVSIYKVN